MRQSVSNRQANDVFALALHVATLGIIATYSDPFQTAYTPAVALTVMQGTATLFHVAYLVFHRRGILRVPFDNVQNQFKWIEFAISATAGTVAVLCVESVEYELVIPLAAGAVFQQLLGLNLDPQGEDDPNKLLQPIERVVVSPRMTAADWWWKIYLQYIAACIVQLVEFYWVIDRGGPLILKVTYIIAWSSFGIHAGLRLAALRKVGWQRYANPQWVETVYSCLGWTAKIAVFSVEWAHLNGVRESQLNLFALLDVVLAMAVVVTAIA